MCKVIIVPFFSFFETGYQIIPPVENCLPSRVSHSEWDDRGENMGENIICYAPRLYVKYLEGEQ